jgi:hypothetical protein
MYMPNSIKNCPTIRSALRFIKAFQAMAQSSREIKQVHEAVWYFYKD